MRESDIDDGSPQIIYCDSPRSATGVEDNLKDQKPHLEDLESGSRSDVSSGQSDDIEFVNTDAAAIEELERTKKAEANRKRRERDKRKRDEEKARKQGVQTSLKSQPKSKSKSKPVPDQDDDSDSTSSSDSGKAAKKQKQELEEAKVTVYIHIQSSTPRLTSSSKSKAKGSTPPVSIKGPCFFQINQTYDEFKAILAWELPCKLKLLPTDHVSWKYEKPANDPKKPLTSGSGYEALTMSLKQKKPGQVILVFMPPPKIDDVTWDTGDGDYVAKPYDHYEEVASLDLPDLSAKAQIANILSDSSGHLGQLQEKYPIGNCNLFPDIRVLTRILGGKPHYWELTLLRLQIWANKLSTRTEGVTLETPPNSVHFDVSACIKRRIAKPEDAAVPATNAEPGPNPLPAAPPQMPPPPIYPAQYPVPPPWMYAHQQMPGGYPYPPPMNYPAFPYGQQPGPLYVSPLSSPGTALQLRIPLADFCTRYDISKSDEEKLGLLEYKPGNNAVLTLTPDDWKEVKFTVLGWKAFVSAHKQFLRDVKDGLWNQG